MAKVSELSYIFENNMPLQNGSGPVDPAFEDAGQRDGLQIWRIEKMEVVPLPREEYGTFYDGDAYIILASFGSPATKWNVHFWLGSKSSQDEQGVAAIKTVELDDYLRGVPLQYREVEGHESKLFLSYFKNGIRYLQGGVASGFNRIDEIKFVKRLFLVKGKRNCRVTQLECSIESLNQGDVFVLDCNKNIYVWAGPKSSIPERTKGAQLARDIRDHERAGRAAVHLIDDEWNRDKDFYNELGSHAGFPIKEAEEAEQDNDFEFRTQSSIKLFRVSDASGKMEMTEIDERPLKKEHLDSNDCFVVDMGASGIYAWVGNRCSKDERRNVWTKATEFLSHRGLPVWTPVALINEGTEPAILKTALNYPIDIPTLQSPTSNVAQIDQSLHQLDVNKLHQKIPKATEYMPDDGSGQTEVWRIENFTLVPVEPDNYGVFYAGDCYIVLYKYSDTHGREQSIIYFWQGARSSRDEIGAAAMMAVQIDERETRGMAIQIRVVQNKEPAHFVSIFGGKMVVLMGGAASGFKNINDKDSYDTDGVRLFQIRDNKIIQVPERSSALNSNDAFVLETPENTYIWYGKGASDQERQIAVEIAKNVVAMDNAQTLEEGEESDDFWSILGGQEPYASGRSFEVHFFAAESARLFHCSNARGYFHIEEIVDYCQSDLMSDDVMLLDAWDTVFIWIGSGANDTEKKEGMKTAIEYVQSDPLNRSLDNTAILTIKQGFEPPAFTGHFGAWDPDCWNKGLSYEDLKAQLGAENVQATTVQEEISKFSKTHSLKVLQERAPEGVDPARKEYHLSEDEFASTFGMTMQEYDGLAQWKKLDLKKKHKLF